jgi:hypothetical protein
MLCTLSARIVVISLCSRPALRQHADERDIVPGSGGPGKEPGGADGVGCWAAAIGRLQFAFGAIKRFISWPVQHCLMKALSVNYSEH